MTTPTVEDHTRWLAYLGTPDCPCRSEWRSLGALDRIDMGKGWVRMDTDPDCPRHELEATKESTDGR